MQSFFSERQVKKQRYFYLLLALILSLSFLMPAEAADNGKDKMKGNFLTKEQLLEKGVSPKKVDKLIKKMKNGEKLDSDIYLASLEKDGLELATSENSYFRKDFNDGSFIESGITDITEEVSSDQINNYDGQFSTSAVEQIGGTQEYRTLKVYYWAPWGYMSYRVKIYFPLIGYGKILQAYEWYYVGAVISENYKGIYRASETATQDAVAIYKVQVGIRGISYLAKLEFRIRDGSFWSVYSS